MANETSAGCRENYQVYELAAYRRKPQDPQAQLVAQTTKAKGSK
jgi:hypothetical protein